MKPTPFPLAIDRGYLTPEDIDDALKAGARTDAVRLETLDWIGRKRAEDPSCCAFVAWKGGDSLEVAQRKNYSARRLERVRWQVCIRGAVSASTFISRSEAFEYRRQQLEWYEARPWEKTPDLRVFRVSVFKVRRPKGEKR